VGVFMYQLIKDINFHLITGFGKSISSYSNTENNKTGQGLLQVSSSACPIFILNSNVSLSAYQCNAKGVSFLHPISGKKVTDHVVQFVDNTLQFVNAKGLPSNPLPIDTPVSFDDMMRSASDNAQLWADYLWLSGSGGKLNLSKCFYYAFQPSINYKKNEVSYASLPTTTTHIVLRIQQIKMITSN